MILESNNMVLENSYSNIEDTTMTINEDIKVISINTEVFTSSFSVLESLHIHKS